MTFDESHTWELCDPGSRVCIPPLAPLKAFSSESLLHFFFILSVSISSEVQEKFCSSANVSLCLMLTSLFLVLKNKSALLRKPGFTELLFCCVNGRWAQKQHLNINCSCTATLLSSREQLPLLTSLFYFSTIRPYSRKQNSWNVFLPLTYPIQQWWDVNNTNILEWLSTSQIIFLRPPSLQRKVVPSIPKQCCSTSLQYSLFGANTAGS